MWCRIDVRGFSHPAIRRSGRFAWQAFDALIRIAKERADGGFVPDDRADGFELGYWTALPDFEAELEQARDRLVTNGLIERVDGGFQIVSWSKYQEDPGRYERVKKHRAKRSETDETDETGCNVSNRFTPIETAETTTGQDRTGQDTTGIISAQRSISAREPTARAPAPDDLVTMGSLEPVAYETARAGRAALRRVDVTEAAERLLGAFNRAAGTRHTFASPRDEQLAAYVSTRCLVDGQIDPARIADVHRMIAMVGAPAWRRQPGSPKDWCNWTRVFGTLEKTDLLVEEARTWGGEVGVPPAPERAPYRPKTDAEIDALADHAERTEMLPRR
jgi:hypothetical protein